MSAAAPVTPAEIGVCREMLADLRSMLVELQSAGLPMPLILASTALSIVRLDEQVAVPLWNFCTAYTDYFDATVKH